METLNSGIIQILWFLAFVALGYFAGTYAETRHYRSIRKREKDNLDLPAVTFRNAPSEIGMIEHAFLVQGSAVISLDYFKRVLAALRNIFGGRVKSYESLLDRARREAILRMKEKAVGAQMIVNVRIETASIGSNANQRKTVGAIEAVAYGTAIFAKT